MKDILYNRLTEVLPEENIKQNELLKNYTTFKIGGPADYLLSPSYDSEIIKIIEICKDENIPYYVIGNGSNLLVRDKGYRGVIIHIGKNISGYSLAINEGLGTVIAGAGNLLISLAKKVSGEGLTGFEFATGIPGTLGGAVTMNAGAYGGEINDVIKEAKVICDGEIISLNKEQLKLGYRSSIIQSNSYIVLESTFLFNINDKDEINKRVNELTTQRKLKQPLEFPSAGSTFKRPEGHFAGKLIMDAGLRGYRVGNVMISEKHCGFVVNVGNGTANDVIKLMDDVDRIVYEKYNIHLEPEIKIIGD